MTEAVRTPVRHAASLAMRREIRGVRPLPILSLNRDGDIFILSELNIPDAYDLCDTGSARLFYVTNHNGFPVKTEDCGVFSRQQDVAGWMLDEGITLTGAQFFGHYDPRPSLGFSIRYVRSLRETRALTRRPTPGLQGIEELI